MRFILFSATLLALTSLRGVPALYTPYQIKVWTIKGSEGYRATWYPDGKRKYSIGYGSNDWGKSSRRAFINKYLHKGRISKESALKLALHDLSKVSTGEKDVWKDLAVRLYAYNTGKVCKGKALRGCDGAKVGCGHKDERVRTSHSLRRRLEYALYSHDWSTANPLIEEYREKSK